MRQPDALKTDRFVSWSNGPGHAVWRLLDGAARADVGALQALLDEQPALIHGRHDYRNAIHFAVMNGRADACRLLLDRGANPLDTMTPDGLLHAARYRGYRDVESLLLDWAVKAFGYADDAAQTRRLIQERKLDELAALLERRPELVNAGDERSNRPIHWAALTRQPLVADLLARCGADLNARRMDGALAVQLTGGDYWFRSWSRLPKDHPVTSEQMIDHLIGLGARPELSVACHLGRMETVRQILRDDPGAARRPAAYVSYYAGSGSALRNAAAAGREAIVRLLLEHGADVNGPEIGIAPDGHALHGAALAGHREIVRLLLDAGARPAVEVDSSDDTITALLRRGDTQTAEMLAARGATRPIQVICYYNDLVTASQLFAANPALADHADGFSYAAQMNHADMLRLMYRHAPGVIRRVAAVSADTGITGWLLDHGMDGNGSNWLGVTCLHQAAAADWDGAARLLIERGARMDARDDEYRSTALGWAARHGAMKAIELLLDRGADAAEPDAPPWATPIAWAKRRGHAAAIERLTQAGARG